MQIYYKYLLHIQKKIFFGYNSMNSYLATVIDGPNDSHKMMAN